MFLRSQGLELLTLIIMRSPMSVGDYLFVWGVTAWVYRYTPCPISIRTVIHLVLISLDLRDWWWVPNTAFTKSIEFPFFYLHDKILISATAKQTFIYLQSAHHQRNGFSSRKKLVSSTCRKFEWMIEARQTIVLNWVGGENIFCWASSPF